MLERDMEELIARFTEDFFRGAGLQLKGRQQSFAEVGRFDLLFSDPHGTNVLMELKARVAKYEDASQLAKYKDELQHRGVTNILMWLVAPQIPNSVREFLDRIGIEYTEIHEAQFRQAAARHDYKESFTSEPVREGAPSESRTPPVTRPKGAAMYVLDTTFSPTLLGELIREFESAGKRRIDSSLAVKLRNELLNSEPPYISISTTKQLAKWCDTKNPLYFDGMEVARKISELLFGRILDRSRLGV